MEMHVFSCRSLLLSTTVLILMISENLEDSLTTEEKCCIG